MELILLFVLIGAICNAFQSKEGAAKRVKTSQEMTQFHAYDVLL